MKKRVAVIGTNGLPAKYGGFETLINYLTHYLKDDFKFTVYCSKDNNSQKNKTYNKAKLIHLPLKANGMQSIIYDIVSIIHAIFNTDVFLILGTPGTIILPLIKFFNKKIIVNFGGLEWKREKWPIFVRKYLKFTEMLGVKFSNMVIADNQMFVDYIKQEYNEDAVLIEYGGDHIIHIFDKKNFFKKYPFALSPYIISVSRAQVDNNIHMLLEGYIESKKEMKLVIISNWQSSDYGVKLKNKYSSYKGIVLLDAIYDQEELDFLRGNAYLYVHTHSFCGTAPSLVEAMHHNIPIICYDAVTNQYTTEGKSLYFKNADELAYLIDNIDKNFEENKKLMYSIAKKRYNWQIISVKYAKILNI